MTAESKGRGPRRDHPARNVQPKHHDTYRREEKNAAAFACDQCGVVRHAGHWRWGGPPLGDVSHGLCPACERIRDRYPAGTIRIPGRFLGLAEEIRHMVDNAAAAEREEHPLERVMDVTADGEGMTVTTTGVHVARKIANKLERRFHAKATFDYPAEQNLLFVEFED